MSPFYRTSTFRALAIIGLSILFTLGARGQDTVAYYTFTGDLEGWTVSDLSAEATGDNWEFTQTGPSGDFAITPLRSTTASGGYLLFDSDVLCSGSQNARIQSPILDLSQDTVVELRWQQRYRRFESAIFVDVSRDGGQTFAPFELSPALMNAEFTGAQGENPDFVTLDISPVAAGEASVVIAFRFFSEQNIFGDEAGCGYSFMVDDVVIANSTLPASQNDLAIVPGSHAGAANLVTPNTQLEALNLGAQVINNGLNSASGTLIVRIFDNSGATPVVVFTDSTQVPMLASGQVSDFLLMPGSFTPPTSQTAYIGRYELLLSGPEDDASADNMARFDFSVSEVAFAKTTGPSIFARPQTSESFSFGNVYGIQGDDIELTNVLFWLRPIGNFTTATTDSVFVEVYGITGDNNSDGDYEDSGEATLLNRQGYTLEGLVDDTRFFVTPLPDTGLALPDGIGQIAVLVRYEDALSGDGRSLEIGGGPDDINTNYDAEQTAAELNGINRSFAIRSVGDGPLLASLFPGFIPDVRAYVTDRTLVNNSSPRISSASLEVWPNPASSLLNWTTTTGATREGTIELHIADALGKTIFQSQQSSTEVNQQIDVSGFPTGVYHISVKKRDGWKGVKRFVKQ
jgi:hypothetical protein